MSSLSDLINDTLQQAQEISLQAWNTVFPEELSELHDLPANIHASFRTLVDKITNQGTLPIPDPRGWLPDQLNPSTPPPPPPAPASSRASSWLRALGSHAAEHPLVYSAVAVGVTGGASYYFFPQATLGAVSPLARLVPLAILPDPKNRPLRLLPATHGVAGEVRKEAIVVLGADSPQGREIALDLERRGFVVVATVSEPAEADVLEKLGRGWIKVLVLDVNESSSVSPFLRSLSTALSLRFPLHSSGDLFARPAQALALTGVVNCLSLTSLPELPCPLEAIENDQARKLIGERVTTVIGVVKGLLPILRSAAARPGAPTGVLVTLVPAASSNLAIPFHSLTSAVNAAISSLLHSLRREVTASSTSNVQITLLEVGFFRDSTMNPPAAAALPIRLESVYAPALARRVAPASDAGVRASSRCARKGSEMRRLSKRVWQILVRPTHAGAVERIGSGSRTYLLVSYLPHAFVDVCLAVQDRLYGVYLSHLRHILASSRWSRLTSLTSRSSRPNRPLPTPPTQQQADHPSSLRPSAPAAAAPSQVPIGDPFVPSPAASTPVDSEHEDSSSQSSIEDFPLGASTASMGGSFVSVGRDEAEGR
ncbi:hypothetical protein NBRC10512_003960 [Rhodotorula toruloides]|uniref:RHTO0S07e05402g1_1 n=2 Tax=Rhodotorula toruloides TaxID=5286 RepID=A0A061B092_RHOTO|nr:short-chain dehydrogenase/reductase SDR family protein [Rhodotorula toruloides NP11]EMS25165.1 short-chain dehydrogenase/reductase SDR family protein [Rhodotorula toruloides NP11]CDR42910.1 RHTO0S07e05402g1_1 [Rhodotorula toruloides]